MPAPTILIVDDDVTALDIVDLLFEEKGFVVRRCSDGSAAVEDVRAAAPDAVLVDLMMPGMDGRECVERLRAGGLTVPIIAFTALDDPDAHREAREAGCDLVLTKPCRPKLLVGHVERLTGRSAD